MLERIPEDGGQGAEREGRAGLRGGAPRRGARSAGRRWSRGASSWPRLAGGQGEQPSPPALAPPSRQHEGCTCLELPGAPWPLGISEELSSRSLGGACLRTAIASQEHA
ncbi:unnamed protein product [Prorocentrum cordatum]|uniref:Uncharacterized protein n=1 Tax=Prorocentrum cordatum TaxID=2364126 RepID=A0ABN9U3H3_9DINO|nr:unnamed protein product [Polarella glacialis]